MVGSRAGENDRNRSHPALAVGPGQDQRPSGQRQGQPERGGCKPQGEIEAAAAGNAREPGSSSLPIRPLAIPTVPFAPRLRYASQCLSLGEHG